MATAVMTARRNQNLHRETATLKLGPTSATFVVIALISVLSLLYLNQVTKTSVFGYHLSALKQQQAQILAEKHDLSVEAGRLQSIQATRGSAVVAKMSDVQKPLYANR